MFEISDPKNENELLNEARKCFERTLDHYDSWASKYQEDLDFRHGRQWAEADVQMLRKENRPALTFNLIHGKVNHIMGTMIDNVRAPRIMPVCIEDRPRAEILEYLRANLYRQARLEEIDLQVFEDGVSSGISGLAIDVMPSYDDPNTIELVLVPVDGLDVLWDPASELPDKSDARFNIWTRWISKADFKVEYPEHVGKLEEVLAQRWSDTGIGWTQTGAYMHDRADWDYFPRRETLYYDRKRQMVRIIRLEYLEEERETLLVNVRGERKPIAAATGREIVKQFPGQFALEQRWVQQTKWLDFVGHQVLFNDYSPVGIKPFSIIPYTAFADDENMPYGVVRLLKDPQREFNKRHSQTLHLINQQVAPGVLAEENAFVDKDQAERSLKQPGSVTYLETGALTQGKIQPRQVPTFPEAVAKMSDFALRTIDLIAGVHSDSMMEPRGIPEAAATTQLKHRQGLMAMQPVLRRWWAYQGRVCHAIVDVALRFFSDAQLTETIARDGQFIVQNGMVVMPQNPEFPPVAIRSLRDLRFNTELVPADDNQTERILTLQTLMALKQLATPIAPDVLFEVIGLPKEKVERLKLYAAQAQQAATQAQQAELQLERQKQMGLELVEIADKMLEAGRLKEEIRSNQANEVIKALTVGFGNRNLLLELWARANEQTKELLFNFAMERVKAQSGGGSQQAA